MLKIEKKSFANNLPDFLVMHGYKNVSTVDPRCFLKNKQTKKKLFKSLHKGCYLSNNLNSGYD